MGYRWQRSLWGVFFILNFCLSLLCSAGPINHARPWSCQFTVRMSGNPYEFYRVGFDSWDGLGQVRCTHGVTGETSVNEWYFIFRSWSRSTGADSRNTFVMESSPFDVVNPGFVGSSYFYQTSMALGNLLGTTHFVISLAGQNARIKVAINESSLPGDLATSMTSGSLIISLPPTELNAFR